MENPIWRQETKALYVRSDGKAEAVFDPAGFWCWAVFVNGERWRSGRWLETSDAAQASAEIALGERRGHTPR